MPEIDNPVLAPEEPTQPTPLAEVTQETPQADPKETAEPVDEAVPPTTGEAQEETEEEPPPELPEGWDRHELAAERFRKAESAGYNKAKSHLTRAHTATLTELEATHAEELTRAGQEATAVSIARTVAESLQGVDMEDPRQANHLGRILQENEAWANVLTGASDRRSQATLVNLVTGDARLTADLSEETVDEFNATVKEMSLKLRSTLTQAKTRDDIAKAYANSLSTYLVERDKLRDKAIVEAALDKERKRLESIAKRGAGLTERAEARENGAAPVRPTGRAGGRSVEEELADPKTSVKRLAELRGYRT